MNKSMVLGLLFTAVVTALGVWVGNISQIKALGLSSVTMAIIIGIIFGNTIYSRLAPHCHEGVNFAKGRVLRLGIILYGFHVTLQQIAQVGPHAIIADLIIVAGTFTLTLFLGRKLFHIDPETVMLIGAGSSICGAAAVMATDPIVKAHSSKVTIAVSTVVIFGTIGIFLYPAMYHWQLWPFGADTYGIYIGSSVHEVAQVYAAGAEISQDVANAAVTTKMIRVMLLAPFLLILSWYLAHQKKETGAKGKIVIPWFAIAFIVVACFNSLNLLPESWVKGLQFFDTLLLTMAMGALGITTHFGSIKQAGIKPIILGALIMVWLVLIGGFLQVILNAIL